MQGSRGMDFSQDWAARVRPGRELGMRDTHGPWDTHSFVLTQSRRGVGIRNGGIKAPRRLLPPHAPLF